MLGFETASEDGRECRLDIRFMVVNLNAASPEARDEPLSNNMRKFAGIIQ